MHSARPSLVKEKFNSNNPAHIDLIAKQLEEFHSHLKPLRNLDMIGLEIPAGVSTFLWLTTACNFVAFIALNSVLYFGNQYLRSNIFEAGYQEHLGNLLNSYKWYKNGNAPILQNETLRDLEKTIALYVDKAHLTTEAPVKKSLLRFFRKTPADQLRPEVKEESVTLTKIANQVGEGLRLWRYGYKSPEKSKEPFDLKQNLVTSARKYL